MTTGRVAAAAMALTLSGTAAAGEWQWSVTPYVWATDVGIDVSIADRELVDTTISFEDLLKDLETAALFRAEGMRGEHGISIDIFNVALTDDNDRFTLPEPVGGDLVLDSQIGMTILDLTGVYDPDGDGIGLSMVYGLRVIHERSEIDAELIEGGSVTAATSHDSDDRYVDGLLGFRYAGRLPGRWGYQLAADVSTGGTDFTWSVEPAIAYTFGDRDQYRLSAGYRHLAIDLATGEPVDSDMTLTGLLVGFRFMF